jgi:diguanylate cyclase (GGDEF)-like protein
LGTDATIRWKACNTKTSGKLFPLNRVLGTLLLFVATSALALDPTRALTQARLSLWTSDAGLPQNTIEAIVQTRDGYLWLGTEEGLVRFDGVRFVISDRQSAPELRSSFVSSLFEAPDGTLWIGTYGGGLARLRNGRIEAFHPEILGGDRIRKMYATHDGVLYVATAGGGVLRIEGDRMTRVTTRDGLPTDRIWAVEDDGAGGLWIATHGGGVVRLRGSRVAEHMPNLPNEFARAILRDPDGTLWIGTEGGLAVWRGGAIVRVITMRDGLPSNVVRALLRDGDGSLWIGTDAGLVRWRNDRAESIGVAEGLTSPAVGTIMEDREKSLWFGTSGGLARLTDTRFLSFTRKSGMSVDAARAIMEDRDGRVWAGTDGGGLCRIFPGPVQCLTTNDGLPHNTVYVLEASRDGSLWIGTDGGGVVRMRDGKFVDTIDAKRNGIPNDRVRALIEDADGSLWISTTTGLAHVRNGKASRVPELEGRQLRPLLRVGDDTLLVGIDGAGLWRVDTKSEHAAPFALAGQRIFSIASDGEGGVWVGTSGNGLGHVDLKSGAARSLARRDGLHDDVVFQVTDSGSDLWMTSNRGLYRVARDRVLSAMRGKAADLSGTVYASSDGLPSAECNAAFPGALRTRDGRLWVATARGVAVINPTANIRNTVAPQVHVEEVLLDGNAAPAGPLHVPPGTQRLEIRYTALALRAPERVRFRYMLEGYDNDWIDAGTSRVAHYTKLAPGHYTFRVTATNEDGVRSNAEARLTMTVAPQWFETWWARLLAILAIVALIAGVARLRLASELEKVNRQLEIANERLRALSYMDGLTGVANRRRFDEALEDACNTARKDGSPLSLVLIDLDHFKNLNDTQGHQNGDEALRTVASLLADRAASRGGLVARFGGEEFAWLLPGVPAEVAKAEAESFRLSVKQTGIITASAGVSSSNALATLTPPSLVAAADAALYRAKSGGRDRVEGM